MSMTIYRIEWEPETKKVRDGYASISSICLDEISRSAGLWESLGKVLLAFGGTNTWKLTTKKQKKKKPCNFHKGSSCE